MKIVMVIPKLILAGAETMCENLSLALAGAGHQVTVAALFDGECAINKRLADGGVKVVTLGKKGGLDFSMFGKLRQLFMDEKPDAIHTHLYVTKYAIPASRGLGLRKVHTMHNVANMENLTPGGNFLNRIFFKCGGVTPVALSERIQESVAKKFHIKAEKIPVVYNGIPLSRCLIKTGYAAGADRDDDMSGTGHAAGGALEILNVGRLTEQKNQAELVKAAELVCAKHKNVHFTILGDGELFSDLSKQIEQAGLQDAVTITPPTDNVYPMLKAADIFALPSVYEGMPMTILEAMGTGLPILAGNVGGIPDMIVDEVSGLLCKPVASDIAAGLNRLIENEQLREELGRSALRESVNFSSEKMAEKYLKIYES